MEPCDDLIKIKVATYFGGTTPLYTFLGECTIEKDYHLYCKCGQHVCNGYSHIIVSLMTADLLPNDYKPICCFCSIEDKKYGV
jgi:hypothetical protein